MQTQALSDNMLEVADGCTPAWSQQSPHDGSVLKTCCLSGDVFFTQQTFVLQGCRYWIEHPTGRASATYLNGVILARMQQAVEMIAAESALKTLVLASKGTCFSALKRLLQKRVGKKKTPTKGFVSCTRITKFWQMQLSTSLDSQTTQVFHRLLEENV